MSSAKSYGHGTFEAERVAGRQLHCVLKKSAGSVSAVDSCACLPCTVQSDVVSGSLCVCVCRELSCESGVCLARRLAQRTCVLAIDVHLHKAVYYNTVSHPVRHFLAPGCSTTTVLCSAIPIAIVHFGRVGRL